MGFIIGGPVGALFGGLVGGVGASQYTKALINSHGMCRVGYFMLSILSPFSLIKHASVLAQGQHTSFEQWFK